MRASIVLVLFLAACGSGLSPRSGLDSLRVLAIEADPVEVGPGEPVSLRPTVFAPSGVSVVKSSWTLCPLSAGARAAYACLSPKCEFPLAAEASGRVQANPSAAAVQCALALADGSSPAPSGAPAELPESVEAIFTLTVEASDGTSTQAVQRVQLWTKGPPPVRNRPPAIARVWVGDRPASALPDRWVSEGAALDLRVEVDPASLDSFADASGKTVTEEPVVSFYATAGRFKGDRASGLDSRLEWRAEHLPPDAQQVAFYVVVRDLRGGEAVGGPYLLGLGP